MKLSIHILLGILIVCFASSADGNTSLVESNEAFRVSRLRQQWAVFNSLSPLRQKQIRELDAQIHESDEATQKQYRKVMENYLVWLDRLPESERKKLSVMTAEDKLILIKQIRQREWIDSLPKAYRDRFQAAKDNLEERRKLIEQWKEEQILMEDDWEVTQRHWGDQPQLGPMKLFELPEVKELLPAYLANLNKILSSQDQKKLEKAKELLEGRFFLEAGRMIYQLSEQNILLPGPETGPKNWDSLPEGVKNVITRGPNKPIPNDLRFFTSRLPNRWPDYAIAVSRYAHGHGMKFPAELGPSKLSEMPAGVREFVEKKLIPELQKSDRGKRDLRQLQDSERRWPEYPMKILELARNQGMTIPGWTLPAWDLWVTNFKPRKDRNNRFDPTRWNPNQ
jgi:hypothetical protein